jgi:inhibitor of KinA sporulation pathway (predicted exonuclease)
VVFDLEYTSWPGSNDNIENLPGKHHEIVQIGAIIIQMHGDILEVGSFQTLVCPQKNPVLSDYFVNLTGITQEQVEREGVLFPLALKQFMNFIGEHSLKILSNGCDDLIIQENCRIHNISFPSVFLNAINLKSYFAETLGLPLADCVSGVLPELFGLKSGEKAHDALADSRSIAQVLRYLWVDGRKV